MACFILLSGSLMEKEWSRILDSLEKRLMLEHMWAVAPVSITQEPGISLLRVFVFVCRAVTIFGVWV